MGNFWSLARGMLTYRAMLVWTGVFAVLSAFNLGVGLLGIGAIIDKVIPSAEGAPVRDLPVMAADLNSRLGGIIPAAWIEALPGGAYAAVVVLISILGVVTALGAFVNFMHAYLSLTIVGRFVRDLRQRVFAHAVRLPLRTVMTQGPSHFVSQTLIDTGQVGAGAASLISKALIQIAKGMAAFTVALVSNWTVTLIACGCAPVVYTIIRRTSTNVRRRTRRALESQSSMYSTAREALESLRVVKAFTAEPQMTRRFDQAADETLRHEMKVRIARALAPALVELIVLVVLGVLAVVAAKAILDKQLAPSEFVLTLASLGIAGACLRPLTGLQHELAAAAGAADRVAGVLGMPRETGHAPADGSVPPPQLPRLRHRITIENVSHTYPGAERPALREVSLVIDHGQTVAFVGPNGSGKTTLLSLLPRLIDPDAAPPGATAGRVLFDGTDIAGADVESLRRQIGVVTQDTVLFRGTVRANLLMGVHGPDATEDALRAAARMARAEEFILAAPGGYDAPVGEGGVGFSGGQRQRLAIARALLRDPAVLIMDEATSMIDADSEAKIAAAVAEFSRGRTCLIIAHRLSTVVNADRIVVMDQGRIVDSGRHEELLTRCGTYRLIAEHQLIREPRTAAASESAPAPTTRAPVTSPRD